MLTTASRRSLTTMLLHLLLWPLAMVGLSACAAPSLHGIHTADRAVDDPALEGIWSDDSGDLVLKIDRVGYGHYDLTATFPDDHDKRPRSLVLDARLVELGGARFADVVLPESERKALFREYQALAIRTHQLIKVERTDAQLRLLQLDETELEKRIAAGTLTLDHTQLDHSDGGPELLLTAPTPKLQRVLADNASDAALFDEISVVHRLARTTP